MKRRRPVMRQCLCQVATRCTDVDAFASPNRVPLGFESVPKQLLSDYVCVGGETPAPTCSAAVSVI